MKKLASVAAAIFCLVWLTGAGWLPLFQASTGPSFIYAGTDQFAGSNTVFTSTAITVNGSSADRFVSVVLNDQNGATLSNVSFNTVALTLDASQTVSAGSEIYSGLIGTNGGNGPATIVATYIGAAFTNRALMVFVGHGMSHTGGAISASCLSTSSTTTSVNAGDLLIVNNTQGVTFSSSTQTPTATQINSVNSPPNMLTSYWNTVVSTSASFNITPASTIEICKANYR